MREAVVIVVLLLLLIVPAYLLGAWELIASHLPKPEQPTPPPSVAARVGRPNPSFGSYGDYSGPASKRTVRWPDDSA